MGAAASACTRELPMESRPSCGSRNHPTSATSHISKAVSWAGPVPGPGSPRTCLAFQPQVLKKGCWRRLEWMASECHRVQSQTPDSCNNMPDVLPTTVSCRSTFIHLHILSPLPEMDSLYFCRPKSYSLIQPTPKVPSMALGAGDTKLNMAKSLLPRTSSPA